MNSAVLVVVRNPFHPVKDREQCFIEAGQPLAEFAPKLTPRPFIMLRNGEAVLRADWVSPVREGDHIAVVFLPQGGDDGSDPLRIVLTIVVAVFAPEFSGWLGDAYYMAGIGDTLNAAQMLANVTVAVGSAVVINTLAGGTPKALSNDIAAKGAAASPTYSLAAQGNMARLEAAIPVQYGRLCSYPDFAAQPYTEYSGNEQYLYELLCLGAGEYDVEQIRIDDTPISHWEEIETQIVGPHGSVTLFPTNVKSAVEVSGQEMEYDVYLGPFTANDAQTTANTLGLDFVLPRGLFYATDAGGLSNVSITWQCEAREIDDNGDPVGSWVVLGSESVTMATSTPQRISKRYEVSPGRYEVRVKRTNVKQTSSRYGHEIDWSGLRAYLPETRDFGDVTLIALRMRASSNLSGTAARKINVIATRKLQPWNGAAFTSAVSTRSIAWALVDACCNTTWGAGLSPSRVDLDGLLELNTTWTTRGDEFNGRFDSAVSFWEAITKIARAGRAYPFMQGGIVRFTRDQSQSTPVALYSMRNIARGSFSVQYITPHEAQADAIDIAYFDSSVWASRRVRCTLSGGTQDKPAKIDLFGVTSRTQAFREGLYEAACNRYRRKIIKFETDMEGFIPSFGDLIAVAHDLPQWGQTAEATAWDDATRTMTLTEPMTWGTGTHYVGLRKRNGGVDGPIVVTAGAAENQIVLASAPSFTPYVGGNEERTHIVFGPGETWRQPARVISVKPRGLEKVAIECVNEDPAVHTAEDGLTPPAVVYSQLATKWTAPIVEGLTAWSMPGAPEQMLLSWKPAPGAEYYLVEQSSDGETWTRTGEPRAANYTAIALYGAQTLVRVAGVGMTRGAWVTIGYGSFADYMWTNDSSLMWNATDTVEMWRY